jgi:hypothetical protein
MGIADKNMLLLYCNHGAGIAWSVLRLAAGWTVRGSKAGAARDSLFSTPVQTGFWAHPASSRIDNSTFSVKKLERGADQTQIPPPPATAEVKNE